MSEKAEGTNRRFGHAVTTEASQQSIWDLWTDVSTWKNWDKGLKDAVLNGPMARGAKGKIVPLSGPKAAFEITEFEPNVAYALTTKLPFARLIVRRSFVENAYTQFRHEVWFEGPLAGFWSGRFGQGFRVALPPTMGALAALAEQGRLQ